jgi:hypothetical protein
MLRPIRFQCCGAGISTGFHFVLTCLTILILSFDLHKIRLASDLPVLNCCVSRGVSVGLKIIHDKCGLKIKRDKFDITVGRDKFKGNTKTSYEIRLQDWSQILALLL